MTTKRLILSFLTMAFLGGLFVVPNDTLATKEKMPPDMIVFSGYQLTGSNSQQLLAIGNAITDEYGTQMRIIPIDSTTGQLLLARLGKAQFANTGAGFYFAAEGLEDFATIDWGPQPISLVWAAPGKVGMSLLTTKASGIKTVADCKGRRVAHLIGASALNAGIEAWLSFANLTFEDVEVVKFSGYQASIQGLIKGDVDVIFGQSMTPTLHELASSPRGIHWIELPADNKEGWARITQKYGYFSPFKDTRGIGIPKGEYRELSDYKTPTTVCYTDQVSDELVYFLVKAIHTLYPKYKDKNPMLPNWTIEESLTPSGIAPYHPGVVKYLKEIGMWTDEFDKFQTEKKVRQNTLIKAWDECLTEATDKGLNMSKEFPAFWQQAREKALAGIAN